MKRSLLLITLLLNPSNPLFAQEDTEATNKSGPSAEQVQRAIDEFNRLKKSKVNEVTVVLDPESAADDSKQTGESEPEQAGDTDDVAATEEAVEETTGAEEQPAVAPETDAKPKGMALRIEPLRTGNGSAATGDVTIKNSFPVKALAETPAGWKLETTEAAPAYSREVEVKPGTFVTVKITPHLLTPDADGSKIFSVSEPGYDHLKGYQQDQTVGTILEKSISQLDADSIKMDLALLELHRLLASLPKPETTNPKKP